MTSNIITGKWESARRYIQHAPRSDFDAVNREEFMAWIEIRSLPARSILNDFVSRTSNNMTPQNVRPQQLRVTSHGSPSNTSQRQNRGVIRSREESPAGSVSHKSKRPRTAENEKSPCLRCKILKKRVRYLKTRCPQHKLTIPSVTRWNNAAIVQSKASITRVTFGKCSAAIVARLMDCV